MSSASNDQGRAFEYACIITLEINIKNYRPVFIDTDSTEAAKRAWNTQSKSQQDTLLKAADAFVDTLFKAEPLILEQDQSNDVLVLSILKDSDAEKGDVRDIIILRDSINWKIGLSMKHNHFAVKHSRLSRTIDFGNKWYGLPCSSSYWNAVIPIFERLGRSKNIAWKDMRNKAQDIYIPLLQAFSKEFLRAYKTNGTVLKNMFSYLLGIHDFYKVVAIDSKSLTEFQTFNLHGELNKNGKHRKATLVVPLAKLPDEIVCLRFKPNSSNTIELYCNNGWALSFRIHNASTMVEPSLKFDIQFMGIPSNILTINCIWR